MKTDQLVVMMYASIVSINFTTVLYAVKKFIHIWKWEIFNYELYIIWKISIWLIYIINKNSLDCKKGQYILKNHLLKSGNLTTFNSIIIIECSFFLRMKLFMLKIRWHDILSSSRVCIMKASQLKLIIPGFFTILNTFTLTLQSSCKGEYACDCNLIQASNICQCLFLSFLWYSSCVDERNMWFVFSHCDYYFFKNKYVSSRSSYYLIHLAITSRFSLSIRFTSS